MLSACQHRHLGIAASSVSRAMGRGSVRRRARVQMNSRLKGQRSRWDPRRRFMS